MAAAVVTMGCAGGGGTAAEDGRRPVRIGAGPEAEAVLLAHTLQELAAAAGIDAEIERFGAADDVRRAIELGAVDVRPAYTGQDWLQVLGRADPPGDPRTSFARVREFDEPNGLIWMRPAFGDAAAPQRLDRPPANATFAFVTRADGPEPLAELRQLAAWFVRSPDARLCVDGDFGARPDGLQAVLDAYRVPYEEGEDRFLEASPADAVRGVVAGDCVAGLTTATDGEAWGSGLVPLVDDLEVFPAFVVTVQLTEDVRDRVPGLLAAFGPLPAHLTTRLLGTWNARVAAGEPVEVVAADAAATLLDRAER